MYTVRETVQESSRRKLLRAIRNIDQVPVIIKVLSARHQPRDLDRLKNEYRVGSALNLPTVVAYLALEKYQGMPALVMEDSGGESLDRQLGAPLQVGQFLPLAIRIASAVAEIHRCNVVHKDLKPGNVLVHAGTGAVKITDFELAAILPCEQPAVGSARLIEGSLPYISPEQTGRMNRPVDQRSDLYSLGVTFYEMLAGRLPFQATDPVGWVHCHIARAPEPLTQALPTVPGSLSALVLKLLAKEPDERYQNAASLQHDLESCLAQWQSTGRIEPFPLGEWGVAHHFRIVQKLYGRDREVATLMGALDRVIGTGVPELMLVSGEAGIGKSSLVHELSKPLVRQRGFFAAGKFDQFKRGIPYSTIVQALCDLVLDILAETEVRLESWRRQLRAALGVNGQLIVDLIPPLELVLGPQPPVPELPALDAQSRFHFVFRHFLGVFARREHPLVLFLDDLQWADPASLALFQELVTNPELQDLFVVGAYRDNEVSPAHPLMPMLKELRQTAARVSDLVIGPLSEEALSALICDTLRCRAEEAASLVEVLQEKTAGNPFFALQFLSALHEEELVAYDAGAQAWRWDVTRIRARQFTDNVVDLMVAKLKRLSVMTLEAVQRLACVGNSAELGTLVLVLGRNEEATETSLSDAVRAGLILRVGARYTFLHDRVQEAAYSLIPAADRPGYHLRIGQLLLERTPADELSEHIFEIVNQLNAGLALLAPGERRRLAELNLIAGLKAKAAVAQVAAASYLSTGVRLVPADGWDGGNETAFKLHVELAECEVQLGNIERAQELLAALRERVRTNRQLADVACAEMRLNVVLGQNPKGVEVGLACLRQLGIAWTAEPSQVEAQAEYEQLQRGLGPRTIEDLVGLPRMVDPDALAVMEVLTEMKGPALYTNSNLHTLLVCRMANTSVIFGNADSSSFGYASLGLVLGHVFGRFHEAYRFGKLARDLADRHRLVAHRASVYLDFALISAWVRPLHTIPVILRQSFDAALEMGDLTFACYACNNRVTVLLAQGAPLSEASRVCEDGLAFVRKVGFRFVELVIISQHRLILTLQGRTNQLSTFSGAGFDEGRYEADLEENAASLAIATCWFHIWKLTARFVAGDYEAALGAAQRAAELLWTSPSFMEVPEYHYFHALTRAALFDRAAPAGRAPHLKALHEERERLRSWSELCPENFLDKYVLVAAEIARLEGNPVEAMPLYEQAIHLAREHGYVHHEALANELAAGFYRTRGFDRIADTYLREARACYVRWGADGKVKQLDRLYPQLVEQALAPGATFIGGADQLDFLSVTKASQAIWGELVLDKLLRTLVRIVIEQAGAQKGYVLLQEDGQVTLGAEAVLDEKGAVDVRLLSSIPEPGSPLLPTAIFNYVRRTKERVLLDDAFSAPKFSSDEYIARTRPKSVLCLPILKQTALIGLLYLENDLVAGAFTADRLAVLELLASQAAISLENALLLSRELAARRAAEEAQRRAAFLAEASGLLGESLEYEEVLRRLARLSLRDLADWCIIDLIEQGQIRRVASVHKSPSMQALLDKLQGRYPIGLESPHFMASILRSSQPRLVPDVDEVELRAYSVNEEHYGLLKQLRSETALAVPLIVRGQTIGVLGLASERPERRYDQADLDLAIELARRAAVAIDNARLYSRAEEAVRLRDEFLSVASHELRTPINSLQLMVQGLTRGVVKPSPDNVLRAFGVVDRQVDRLTRLVGEMLSVSRLQAGRLELHLEELDLAAVAGEVVQRLELDSARVGCAVALRASTPVRGLWDRSWIDHVVTNLLSNAIKFSVGKPIEITVEEKPAGIARLVVVDQGIGIPAERLPHLFQRFERAVSAREYGGLGLGLYIVRGIVERLGGTVQAESKPGVGSTFTVELPCAGPPPTEAPAADGPRGGG